LLRSLSLHKVSNASNLKVQIILCAHCNLMRLCKSQADLYYVPGARATEWVMCTVEVGIVFSVLYALLASTCALSGEGFLASKYFGLYKSDRIFQTC